MNQAFCKKEKNKTKENKNATKKVKLSLSVSAFFGCDVDPGMTLQRKLKPFFCIPFHSPEVQHPIEKSRAKNFLTKVIRAVAKVYVQKKRFRCYWHLKWSKKIVTFLARRSSEKPKEKFKRGYYNIFHCIDPIASSLCKN